MKRRQGFTLIELLIVVAIIAVLAAIAVPNFLEAQTRSKVSRVMADQRTLCNVMELYYVDYNSFPLIAVPSLEPGAVNEATNAAYQAQLKAYVALTTPMSYMSTARLADTVQPRGGHRRQSGPRGCAILSDRQRQIQRAGVVVRRRQ